MKGSFFLGAGQKPAFELRELQLPELPDDGVLVRNMACGVCGTDVNIYHGEQGSAPVTPPVVLGHEFSGIVERVGASVRSVKPGDHVALDPNMYCGKCRACRMGKSGTEGGRRSRAPSAQSQKWQSSSSAVFWLVRV